MPILPTIEKNSAELYVSIDFAVLLFFLFTFITLLTVEMIMEVMSSTDCGPQFDSKLLSFFTAGFNISETKVLWVIDYLSAGTSYVKEKISPMAYVHL